MVIITTYHNYSTYLPTSTMLAVFLIFLNYDAWVVQIFENGQGVALHGERFAVTGNVFGRNTRANNVIGGVDGSRVVANNLGLNDRIQNGGGE